MINIKTSQEITKIYLVENCYGDPNKVYIGKTKNCRKSNHKKLFGKDIIYTYIDEINSLNKKYWKPLECFWIEQFRIWGFDIQNKNKGGGGPEFRTEETKGRISKSTKGLLRPKPKGFGLNISDETRARRCKDVIQYDLEGNFIKEWPSIKYTEKELGINGIQQCCIGKNISSHGFLWRYKKDAIINYIPHINKHSKPIIQINKEGNIINEFESITKASNKLNINLSDISQCCKGNRYSAGGFIWKYK